ncbi:MAG: hypothetical protein HQL56_06865 [Magnetococcales bacterium]|nr:hypothetical protein [Magnetococcales bacterium]
MSYAAAYQEQDDVVADRRSLEEAAVVIVSRLQREAQRRLRAKAATESRWAEDYLQYSGEYSAAEEANFAQCKESGLFLNITRPKTETASASILEMLFPANQRNWGIVPTPVPQGQNGQRIDPAEAKAKAGKMSSVIDDQLTECDYAGECRMVIQDATLFGTGILKGPIIRQDKPLRRFVQTDFGWEMIIQSDTAKPVFKRVDPCNFFPSPNAKSIDESEDFFERHPMTRKQLRELARMDGFDKEAIRNVLRSKPGSAGQTAFSAEAKTSGETLPEDHFYQVWEYHGCLEDEELTTLCACLGREDIMTEMSKTDDPLLEVPVVVWFCETTVFNIDINPLDSQDHIYSAFCFERDPYGFWGIGVPRMMRDSQTGFSAAVRTLMNNAGLSSGPMIEIDESVAVPADKEWTITPRKVFRRKREAEPNKPAIRSYDIPSHQAELTAMAMMFLRFMDLETSITELAQGEQGQSTTTASGMSMLLNATNRRIRKVVVAFDDSITKPCIDRIYQWNMQFGEDESVKGDFQIEARGSAVLMERGMTAQNLMAILNFAGHPVVGQLLKSAPVLRKWIESMMLSPDDIVLTDEEIQQAAQQQTQQTQQTQQGQQGGEPEMAKLQVQLQIAKLDAESRLEVARINYQAVMARLEAETGIKVEDMSLRQRMHQDKIAHEERAIAAEIGVGREKAAGTMGQGM